MRAALSTLWILASIGCSDRASDSATEATITNYETEENLASFEALECISISGVKNTNTPADLFPAVRKCIDADQLDRAAALYALAGVYGRFDMLRVEDESAHQAVAVLQMNSLGTLREERAEQFRTHLKANFDLESPRLQAICAEIENIGPPRYEPIYMVQHGMDAFLEPQGD